MDMFTNRRRQDELMKVAEQAAGWLVALEDGGAKERAAFAEWLEESPLHVEMFLRASSVDRIAELMAPEDVRTLAQKNWGDAAAMIERIGMESPFRSLFHKASEEHARPSRRWIAGLAAGIVALACGAVWYAFFGPHAWQAYATRVGEQRSVALDDGSVVYVNTDTRMTVRYSTTAREVRLAEGEALFKVERDAKRPFLVHVGAATVQAVGTQFNVYRRSQQTTVAVIEGEVRVSEEVDSKSVRVEHLAAGQAVKVAARGEIARAAPVNVAQVTAWRQRRLVFEWETLATIAAEFNRYNRTLQIRVENAAVGSRRYTAVFDADHPQSLIKFLSRDPGLTFETDGKGFVIGGR